MSWEHELGTAFRRVEELVSEGLLSIDEAQKIHSASEKYQFLLPKYYASLIDRNDPDCPIRLQAIPQVDEENQVRSESPDPLQDLQHQPVQRLTHRYQSRVLLHLTPNCSMYCRFCFRKSLLNDLKTELFSGAILEAINYLRENRTINEVIFSGGDPFMVSDATLQQTLQSLADIPHIKRVRFHTRVPVTLPSRVNSSLVTGLTSTRFSPVIVTHFNHPRELTTEAKNGLAVLKDKTTLLNQSVLLKKVNDKAPTLIELSEKLFESGVLPYYLHQLDPAQGTRHFYVDPVVGKRVWEEMKKQLPGYLVPRYVYDNADDLYKREVGAEM